jgi:DNA-nicking Smr family endonuclease
VTRKRSLSEDERVLWRTVTRSIAPLRGRHAVPEEQAESLQTEPKSAQTRSTAAASRPSAARAAGAPPLAPLGRRMKQRLARGTADIDGRIDLHGLTQAEAHAVLQRFLHQAQARDAKVVLVITGKGGADPHAGRGVLRRQVPLWLESAELRPLVVGFENASIGHGGAGALYVRVRRGR